MLASENLIERRYIISLTSNPRDRVGSLFAFFREQSQPPCSALQVGSLIA
jgi:hypothetical protein